MVEELEEKVSGFKFQVREKKMAKVQKFEELKIWQDAREVAKRVHELTRSGEFAKDFQTSNPHIR